MYLKTTLLMICLLHRLWQVHLSLHQRRSPTKKLGSPIWPQQPGPRSGMLDKSWIQTLFTSIQPTKRKPLTRRSSPLARPWTPVLLITLFFATASGTKIVFEEIGHMAGALSYQHVVIPINLTSLTLQANSLDGVIQFYEDQICDTYDNADPMNHSMYKPSTKAADYAYMNRVLNTINMAGQYNVTNTHCLNLKSLLSRIQDLKELFPNVDANAEETTCQLNHHQQFIEDFKKKIIDFSNVR